MRPAQPIDARARRWLILSQYYAPEIGAPQIRLRAVARQLRRHGIEIDVLTALPNYPAGTVFPAYRGRWRCEEEIDGIRVRRRWVYGATGRSAVPRLLNYLSFTFSSMLTVLFGRRPDLMFVESQPLSLGVVAVLAKWLRGVPYIYNVPDLQVDVARQMGFLKNGFLLGIALRLENAFLRNAERVSTVTEEFIRHFEQRGIPRDRITFLPNGADTDFLRPLPPNAPLQERWDLGTRKVFVYVGTHAYYHGLDTLLDAAERLKDRNDIVVLMVGDGPERERLRVSATERGLKNVIFGQSPYEEMADLYSIAYASVATLRNVPVAEKMRLSKVFPSLSCGVPVIYAGSGEAASLLVDQRCGLATPPEDGAALAKAISDLASDRGARDGMGQRGRAFVLKEYGWRGIVDRWLGELGLVQRAPLETAREGA